MNSINVLFVNSWTAAILNIGMTLAVHLVLQHGGLPLGLPLFSVLLLKRSGLWWKAHSVQIMLLCILCPQNAHRPAEQSSFCLRDIIGLRFCHSQQQACLLS